jgi:hypothetical protein
MRRAHSSRSTVRFCRRCCTSWGSKPSVDTATVAVPTLVGVASDESDI